MRRPKLITILLTVGFLILVAGGALAATLPSSPSHKSGAAAGASGGPTSSAPAASASAASPAPSPAPSARATGTRNPKHSKHAKAPQKKDARTQKHKAAHTITYVVKAGDTLSGIAEWFKLHGYTGLYDWNKSVIGTNPNLIFPGQRITISSTGVMTLGSEHS